MQRPDLDAAFFEDWSEWASLDDLPPRPTDGSGHAVVYGHRAWGAWSRYYCLLHAAGGWVGGPYFEISVPPNAAIARMVRALPGAAQHPGLWGTHGAALSGLRETWQIPARHWRAIRDALPAIKAATVKWVRL